MKKSVFIFAAFISLLPLQISFSQDIWNLPGEEIKVPAVDFHNSLDKWRLSNVEESNFKATEKDSVLTIDCAGPQAGKTSWNYYMDYNKTSFRIPKNSVARVFFDGKCKSGDGSLSLMVSGLQNGKKGETNISTSKTISSAEFQNYRITFQQDESHDAFYLRFSGKGKGKYEIKNFKIDFVSKESFPKAVTKNEAVYKDGHFEGLLSARSEEKLGRGLSAIKIPESGVLVTWRFLDSDTKDTAFTVSKVTNGKEKLISRKPVTDSSNFKDNSGKAGDIYVVRSYTDSSLSTETGSAKALASDKVYRSIKFQGDTIARGGFGVGDLDGDGELDYVLKTSAEWNIDPAESSGWHPSKKPLTLEAYTHDGKFLWKKDLGWNIESGIWYSPYIVADLDGDGKCEVIAKTGEYTSEGGKDYRDSKGKVQSGPQYLSVLDGLTGKEITRTDWVSWEAYDSETYPHSVRNQIALAYLDGKTPCVVMLSGTYGHQEVKTYFLKDKELVPVWSYNNRFLDKKYQGQGAHWTLCVDIDEDGRDEIIIGSVALDDNGDILWTNGRGHPDSVYYGEINPDHAGKELLFTYETKQKDGGFLLAEPKTGKELWKFNEPTDHIHSQALCSDIDPKIPGREFYGMNSGKNHAKTDKKWYFAGNGKLLKKGNEIPEKWGWAPDVAYITDKPYSSLIKTNEFKAEDKFRFDGTIIHVFDMDGDWREEVVTVKDKEVRIYSTVDVSKNRRPSLLQDKFYRSVVTNNTSGYGQHPELPEGMKFTE